MSSVARAPAAQVDRLLDAARARARLEDFGAEVDYMREGLAVLLASAEREAGLNALGRAVLDAQITRALDSRLEIEDWYRRHPEIEAQETPRPLFILGLPRTGTTAMSALLAVDPDFRSLRTWESAHPCPPPEFATQHSDPRIARAQAGLDAMEKLAPQFKAMHDATAVGPTECQDLLGMTFRAQHVNGTSRVPSYRHWLYGCDMLPAYRYHQRVLKLLQWRCPPTRWRLKTPVHMLHLDALDAVYPDALFLMNHRDPVRVIPSVCSLIHTLRLLYADRDDPALLGEENQEEWELALRRAIAFRDRAGEERFCDLPFEEIAREPLAAVRRIYRSFGERLSAEAARLMQAWIDENPKDKHGAHAYRAEDFGIDPAVLRRRFAFYTDRFGVTLE